MFRGCFFVLLQTETFEVCVSRALYISVFINSQKKEEIQQPNSSLASMSPPKMSLGGDVEQVERCDVEWVQTERSELISIQSQG